MCSSIISRSDSSKSFLAGSVPICSYCLISKVHFLAGSVSLKNLPKLQFNSLIINGYCAYLEVDPNRGDVISSIRVLSKPQ